MSESEESGARRAPSSEDVSKGVSLFERVGGEAGVEKLVDEFYQRVLADGELASFFSNTALEKLRRMQYEFFAAALDGPVKYTGRALGPAHSGLGITRRHVKRFLDHLLETVQGLELSEDEELEVISRINRYVDEITGTAFSSG